MRWMRKGACFFTINQANVGGSFRHVSMFSIQNDGGHDLAIKTVSLITDWMSNRM